MRLSDLSGWQETATMRVRDLPGWPPRWIGTTRHGDDFPQGEPGVLRAVVRDVNQIYLAIEDDGAFGSGELTVPVEQLDRVMLVLRARVGERLVDVATARIPGTA